MSVFIDVPVEKDLEPHKQCEIRRPSPPSILSIGGQLVHKAAGHYFDIVWIKAVIATKGARLADDDGNVWTLAEVFGTKPMHGSRSKLRQVGGTT